MRKYSLILFVVLISFFATGASADVGFGIPDMIEDKVEELDEKVRRFKANQPVFDRLIPFAVQVSNADTDFIASSAITKATNDHRIYTVLDINRPTEKSQVLFLSDGEGKVQSEFELTTTSAGVFDLKEDTATFEQLTVRNGEVHALVNIPTQDSGPLSLIHFRDAKDVSQQAFPGIIGVRVSGDTTDTPVTVNTMTYDSTDSIIVGGDSGVFKYDLQTTIPDWNQQHLNDFRIQDGNLLTMNDTVYLSSVFDTPGGGVLVEVAALDNGGGTVGWIDVVDNRATVDEAKTHLLVGDNQLFLHYQSNDGTNDTDALISYPVGPGASGTPNQTHNYSHGGAGDTHFVPTVFDDGNSRLYAGNLNGEVRGYNTANNASFGDLEGQIDVADSKARVYLQGDNGVYVGTREGDLGAVVEVKEDLSDSTIVFRNTRADTPVNTELMARPVWLKQDGLDGFLGMIFDGATLKMQSDTVASSDLLMSPWPHEDKNNQRIRQVK